MFELRRVSPATLAQALQKEGCVSPFHDPAIVILAALDAHSDLFHTVERAADEKYFQWPLRYDLGFKMTLPGWLSFKNIASLLAARSVALRELGQSQAAARDLVTLLRLSRGFQATPRLTPFMIGVLMERTALSAIWDGLASHSWDAAALAMLSEELQCQVDFDLLSSWWYATLLEGVAAIKVAESVVQGDNPLWGAFDDFESEGWLKREVRVASYKLTIDSFASALLQSTRVGHLTDGRFNWKGHADWLKKRTKDKALYNPFFRTLDGDPNVTLVRVLNTVAMERFAALGLLLEQEFLKSGSYPKEMPANCAFAIDIMNDKNAVYQASFDGSGYQVYSVGWNCSDEQGVLAEHENIWEGDWVWRIWGTATEN